MAPTLSFLGEEGRPALRRIVSVYESVLAQSGCAGVGPPHKVFRGKHQALENLTNEGRHIRFVRLGGSALVVHGIGRDGVTPFQIRERGGRRLVIKGS